jgi:hypothetical protein
MTFAALNHSGPVISGGLVQLNQLGEVNASAKVFFSRIHITLAPVPLIY